jgi:hypothetical protein
MEEKHSPRGKLTKREKGKAPAPIVSGFKYLRLVGSLVQALHAVGTARDRAGNRQLFYDQYATLRLLYFFTPPVTSLRGIQQVSELRKVQERWGVPRRALSTLSEASTVFDAAPLPDVSSELALQAWTQAPHGHPVLGDREQELLGDLGAIDGSLLPALPRMVWALWQDDQQRAAKRPVAFAALRQVPVGVTVTAGNSSEREQTRQVVQPGGFYVCDRGYVEYELFAQWHALPCSFIVRVPKNAASEVAQERPLSAAARAAGVTSDRVLPRLGTSPHRPCAAQPLRRGRVTTDKWHRDGTPIELVLVTNRLD